MPRLSSSLLRHARHLHPLLPLLLRPCRDLTSARNELRWLLEHAISATNNADIKHAHYESRQRLRELVHQRERGKPLQYILGSQPFGDLEIMCRAGVLIPRPETESLTVHLATLVPGLSSIHQQPTQRLRILDLCTGTGCITLLLHRLLSSEVTDIRLCGVDLSVTATKLARKNLQHNIRLGHLGPSAENDITFIQDDIFEDKTKEWRTSRWDIVISNPPYISPDAFDKTTARSVRDFEPRTALVPHQDQLGTKIPMSDQEQGDMFYPRLLQIAQQVDSRVVLIEVADMAQARRVADMVVESGQWTGCEIWRDWPAQGEHSSVEVVEIAGREVRVKGEGHGRAVLAWRNDGGKHVGN